MLLLDTKYKRKSAVITALILMLIIFGIINYGMTYLDPPEEYGLAINFGDSNVGNGEPVEDSKKTVSNEVVQKEEAIPQVKEVLKEITKENIITEETIKDVPVFEKVKEIKKEPVKEVVKKEVPKEKPSQKPSKETQDALNSLLKGNASDGKPKGEGDDKQSGVKGKVDGDAKSTSYYGNTASGSDGNYSLEGRIALEKPKEQPNCQEEGNVVVEIHVDKNGKVIFAKAGVKGTTNSAKCLLEPARLAALKTKWNTDLNAPVNQKGTITYKFFLTNN